LCDCEHWEGEIGRLVISRSDQFLLAPGLSAFYFMIVCTGTMREREMERMSEAFYFSRSLSARILSASYCCFFVFV